jgi:hypothetical protein
MKHSIPPCRAYESDWTILDRNGVRCGVIRAYVDGVGPFNVWSLPNNKYMGEFRDAITAICAATGRRPARKRPHRIAASRQRDQVVRGLPPANTTAVF